MAGDYVNLIGAPVPRVDSPEKARGSAIYSIDEVLPGMLIGKIMTSPYAHARIQNIDVTRAESLTGCMP
jgi:CO/xanthine dehydrogenase Mo-binding subunit